MNKHVVTALVGACGLVRWSAAGEPLQFFEGDFGPGSYTTVVVQGGDGGSSTVNPIPDGGAPNAYLEIRHDLGAGSPPGDWCANWVWTFVWIDGAVIDPGETGCIRSIDYTLTSLAIDGTDPGQSQTLALLQDGEIYLSDEGFVTPDLGAWFEAGSAGLTAANFVRLTNLPPCEFVDTEVPDLSASGAPIQLGFARGNSTMLGGNAQETFIVVGADSWSATVNSTPCPADADVSGAVDIADLLGLLSAWGPCPECCPADLNGDEVIDIADLLALLAAWGPCP